MPKKFSTLPGIADPIISALDEKVLIVRFSTSAGYISITEEHGQSIDAFQGLKVMMQLATQFLAAMQEQMLRQGRGRDDNDTEKSNEN